MASTVVRRPLPALAALLALLLLTGVVWWRVLHRDDTFAVATRCPTRSPSPSQSSPAPAALPPAASISIQVVNSTTRNGIAAAARQTLIADGFQVPAPAVNDPSTSKKTNTGIAQLRFGPAAKQAATHLHYYFPGATMIATTSRTPTVIVALGERYQSIATPKAAAAAMKSAAVVVASPSPTPASPSAVASC